MHRPKVVVTVPSDAASGAHSGTGGGRGGGSVRGSVTFSVTSPSSEASAKHRRNASSTSASEYPAHTRAPAPRTVHPHMQCSPLMEHRGTGLLK
jgi:hypothetical protein